MNLFRYRFDLSYHGVTFSGSQKQRTGFTVFGCLENVLTKLFHTDLVCIPTGRTDAKVHAEHSVCHCDFPIQLDVLKMQPIIDSYLTLHGIQLKNLQLVDSSFHALQSAVQRKYTYFFTHQDLPNYLVHSVAKIAQPPLFIPNDHDLCKLFVGNKNFFSLCNFSSDTKTYIRSIKDIHYFVQDYTTLFGNSVQIHGISIVATGFLYKMMRHTVGIILQSITKFTNIYRKNRIIKYL